jgi:hypothetical protein
MKKTIEVTVAPDGAIQIDALGFKGADCQQATQFLEEALGTPHKKVRKPEYHGRTSIKHQQKVNT